MATDTARVQLELASGRNEVTAPFHETAPRRRQLHQESDDAESVAVPADRFVVAVPMQGEATVLAPAVPLPKPEFVGERPGVARPPWIAFGAALIAVGFGVWWVMSQRLPAIDPAVVIERNLNDAETAMADGRYTDPPERSAFHYYSTVLALDPTNADAIAGIDAIADRHLTNARVLLAEKRIAEAGVALEKARRVRPDQNGLAALDRQWRMQLRKMLAKSTVISKPLVESAAKPVVTKKPASSPAAALLATNQSPVQADPTPALASAPVTADNPGAAAIPPNIAAEADHTGAAAVSPSIGATAGNAGTTALAPSIGAMANNVAAAAVTPGVGAKPENSGVAAIASNVGVKANNAGAAVPPRIETKADNAGAAAVPPSIGTKADNAGAAAVAPTIQAKGDNAGDGSAQQEAAGGGNQPRLIKMVQPEYPQEALIRGIEGWVEVSLQVSASGDVIDPRVEDSSRGRLFNRAALSAVEQWKYEPRSDGATSERTHVRLQFRKSN